MLDFWRNQLQEGVQSLVLSYAQVTQKTASKHTATTTNSSNKSECLFYFYHEIINKTVKIV